MAEEGDSGEKTEAPTARRTSESRKEGQVGQSQELSNVFGITAAFLALQYVAPYLWDDLLLIVKGSFTADIAGLTFDVHTLRTKAVQLVLALLPEMIIIMLIAAFFGAGCTAVQTKFLWSWKLIKPKMMHISPLKGIKRIFSVNNYVALIRNIAKLCIICPIAYFAFFDLLPGFMQLMSTPVSDILPSTAKAAAYVFWKIITCLFILAILDLVWQKYTNYKKLKMSKQEVKDERKAIEGDEATRRRIMAIGLNRARERMLQKVPTADVVVTNPTHYAIAISYSMESGSAPRIVAKGKGYVAQRIKEIAKKHGVPVIERKMLARALFKMAEVGQEIPYEFFRAVAELLAYVYRIRGKLPEKARRAMLKRNQTSGYASS